MTSAQLLLTLGATLPGLRTVPLNDADIWVVPHTQNGPVFIAHEIIVGADGRPRKCTIIRSSGYEKVDALTCASFMKRAKYRPATDDTGQAISGVVRTQSAWSRDQGLPQPPELVDITVAIKPVVGVQLPVSIGIFLTVGTDGQIVACEVGPTSKAPMLNKVACSQAKRLAPFPPVTDDEGRPVANIRNMTIKFVAAVAAK